MGAKGQVCLWAAAWGCKPGANGGGHVDDLTRRLGASTPVKGEDTIASLLRGRALESSQTYKTKQQAEAPHWGQGGANGQEQPNPLQSLVVAVGCMWAQGHGQLVVQILNLWSHWCCMQVPPDLPDTMICWVCNGTPPCGIGCQSKPNGSSDRRFAHAHPLMAFARNGSSLATFCICSILSGSDHVLWLGSVIWVVHFQWSTGVLFWHSMLNFH